jgi:ubiquinone/menaquinone biosynthesis C-methylase UbiE
MALGGEGILAGAHDWHSTDYVEAWINRDVTRDAERRLRLQAMLAHAGFAADAAASVLDVGGGYGVVTEEVLRAYPKAKVTLADYSAPMLAQAKQRLAGFAGRVDYVVADLTDPNWTQAVGGPFDLAVSAIAIHNLFDTKAIAAAYRSVAQLLKPGARFLDYDLFFDRIGGLPAHTKWLTEAGFSGVEKLWEQPPLATIAAHRAG